MDWIKAGKYVRTPNGSVKEILFVSEDNGVKLDDYKYYCASELHPASKPVDSGATKPTLEWWDYEKNEPLDFPPAGTECYYRKGAHPTYRWFIGKIMYISKFVAVVRDNEDGMDVTFSNSLKLFKPLPKLTDRQQAGLKLWRAINWDSDETEEEIITSHAKRFEDYCKAYDQGLLK